MKTSLELLKESGALLEGHFLLSSGRHSDRYFQCARLMQHPDRAADALRPLAELIRARIDAGKMAVDALVGPAMGGIVVAYELGRQLGLPAFFTERDDTGAMTLRRGFELTPGMRILMVEDVVTTGLSTGECAAVITAGGATPVALACIVDRRVQGLELRWPVFASCAVEAHDWDAGTCPLCTRGQAITKPGSRKIAP
ncbi:MAG TPA: orotate phosphoribosyltransferase [bacterium]|nr:orotate phosphoribosyltransferase [bacterium]